MWHFHRWREQARADDGFSLIEVVIGALIAVLALAGLAQTLIAASSSQGSSERSVSASQLAAQEIEKIQALNWTVVGLYAADGAPVNATVDGVSHPTVRFTTTPPATGYRPLPTQSVTVQGTTYTVATSIVWDDSAVHPPVSPSGSRKRILVDVSWNNRGSILHVVAATLRAWPPVQRGPSLFYLITTTAGPSQQLIDEYGYPLSPITLAAAVNRAASPAVHAVWNHRSGASVGVDLVDTSAGLGLAWSKALGAPSPAPPTVLGPNATSPTLSPTPVPDYRFANGSTTFQITATAPGYPTDTRSAAVTFLHNQVYLVPGTLTASRSFCKKLSNNKLKYAVDLDFEVQGFQAADRATVTWVSGLSVGAPTALHLSSTTRGTRQRVTVPVDTVLTGATITFTLVVNRTSALPVTGLVPAPVTYGVTTDVAPTSC